MNKLVLAFLVVALGLPSCKREAKNEKTEKTTQSNESTERIAPDFTLDDLKGKRYTLSEQKGKVVVIDFWATWCPPCRVEIPKLISLYNKYKTQGLIILGIGFDKKEKLNKFAKSYKINYPVLIGTPDIVKTYNIQAIPTTYIIDKEGKIASQHVGFKEGMEVEIEKEIKSLL
ncbi:MAG: TlpA disulfide reductase family protein [bacterium]|nr:TlpA disulfide reductase family protein [bacterium]